MRELSTNAIQRAGGMIQDLPGSIDWCSWPIWTQETTWGYDKTRSTWFVSWRHKIDQNTVLFGIYRWGNLPRNYWLLWQMWTLTISCRFWTNLFMFQGKWQNNNYYYKEEKWTDYQYDWEFAELDMFIYNNLSQWTVKKTSPE